MDLFGGSLPVPMYIKKKNLLKTITISLHPGVARDASFTFTTHDTHTTARARDATMRDAAPFATLSASIPSSARASPERSHGEPRTSDALHGSEAFATRRSGPHLFLENGAGDGGRGDGGRGDGGRGAVPYRDRDGETCAGSRDRLRGSDARLDDRFDRSVHLFLLRVDALDEKLAELQDGFVSGREETAAPSSATRDARGRMDRLLKSPPMVSKGE